MDKCSYFCKKEKWKNYLNYRWWKTLFQKQCSAILTIPRNQFASNDINQAYNWRKWIIYSSSRSLYIRLSVHSSSKVCTSGYINYIIKKNEINALRRGTSTSDELWNYLDRILRCTQNIRNVSSFCKQTATTKQVLIPRTWSPMRQNNNYSHEERRAKSSERVKFKDDIIL